MTQLTTLDSTTTLTITSREIATLTGKEHRNVLADIRTMLDQLGIGSAEFSAYPPNPQNGVPYLVFKLPKVLTITLLTGYSVVMRHRIVTRWMELEATKQAPQATLPTSFREALLLAAAQQGEIEALAASNQALENQRTIAAPQ